jgi:hypothetical protein
MSSPSLPTRFPKRFRMVLISSAVLIALGTLGGRPAPAHPHPAPPAPHRSVVPRSSAKPPHPIPPGPSHLPSQAALSPSVTAAVYAATTPIQAAITALQTARTASALRHAWHHYEQVTHALPPVIQRALRPVPPISPHPPKPPHLPGSHPASRHPGSRKHRR